ncbi:MAG: PSD1 and planctomycete cytochrome C domain-containing protein [Planctomycetaceae bacterium]
MLLCFRMTICTLMLVLRTSPAHAEPPDFNREVRPILAQYCFRCHGADEHSRQAGLRLDVVDSAYGKGESGKTAIEPGSPDTSEVIRRIESTIADEVMPPPDSKGVMPDTAKKILRDWIQAGATYQKHWAWIPPGKSEIPAEGPLPNGVAPSDHPIDRFLRHEMLARGLQPSPEANRYALVRRVYLDLIGLPPTPEEADAFVNDPASDSYERLVDRLLASPRYGERWARRWLDLARYADTNGFEKDRTRSIWPWRDWVVRAINDDMPYDQFSIRQLAGDMLPDRSADDLIATGFHRNTMINEEGGIDPLEYRFYSMVDRVAVTGTTWFGLTLNCAQCHSHKYDPVSHQEYYRLMALLNNADEVTWNIESPEITRLQQEHADRVAKLEAELPSHYPGCEGAADEHFERWRTEQFARASEWNVVTPVKMSTNLPHLELQPDGFVLGSGDISKSDVYELQIRAPYQNVRALQLEVASHPSLPNNGPGLTHYEGPIGGFFLCEVQAFQNDQRLEFSSAECTNTEEEDRVNDGAGGRPKRQRPKDGKPFRKKNVASAALDGDMSSGWQVLGGYGVQHAAVFRFREPVDLSKGITLKFLFEKHFACSLGHFRLSVTDHDKSDATGFSHAMENLLRRPWDQLTLDDQAKVRSQFYQSIPEMESFADQLQEARQTPPRGTPTLVFRERPPANPRVTRRYHRGEYLQPREEVNPAVPEFLPGLPNNEPANRLTFARWLFSPANPLTARVAVNRQWHAFFGRGLVRSLDDFGYQSEPPTHPELLDWLAVEFMENGWSMKSLHRKIVTSAAYRQDSRVSELASSKDPMNLYLSHGARFRLEAEIVRDSSLKAAGILSEKMGGPGVFPPQPESVTTEGTYGRMDWKASEGEDRYRRSIYTFIKRTAPFAMATTFDAPSGESCVARRDVSNSPLQALTLLNDRMFLEAADAMATAVISEAKTDDERLVAAFRRCLTRPPADDELGMLRDFLTSQRTGQSDEKKLWMTVCRALMNLDEAITHP